MKFFFLYAILERFLNNPIAALVVVFIMYAAIDRKFIGILPDYFKPFQRWWKIATLKRQLEFTPSPGQTYYELGALQVESGNMQEGRRNLERAHELMADHPDVEYYLGLARIRTNALDEGKAALEHAIHLNPKIKYGFPYVYLIEYSLQRNEPQEKIDGYMDKIDEYSNPQMLYELGTIFQKAGCTEKAKEMFRQVQVSLRHSPAFMKKQYRYYAIMAKIREVLNL